ncbi:hypothetical protein ACAH01_15325 [Halomicrobium sp. HM KBTZ05]|uniref:hypothetical protein n=1 Tax=Halomicrobium sp. HM KBTZ05 TaxID=3242663 RepID=UPI003557D7D2
MGYKVMSHPTFSSIGKDGNNLSDWSYQGYVVADQSNGDLDADQLGTHKSNTWAAKGYFSEEPTIQDENKGCSGGYGPIWDVEGTGAEFSIAYPEEEDDQTSIHSTAHNPNNGDGKDSFSLSIGAGLGPISVGVSKAFYDGPNLTNNPYVNTEWDLDFGLLGESVPTSQEESVGVRWDFEAESETGWYDVDIQQQYSFRVTKSCSGGPIPIYSSTPKVGHWEGIEIVQ